MDFICKENMLILDINGAIFKRNILIFNMMLFQEAYVDPRSQWIPFSRIFNLRYESKHIFKKKFKASPQVVNGIVGQDGISSVLGRYI